MIVVAAIVTPEHPKAPEIEQVISAGCAAEHMQIAAQALGYGSIWVTGSKATSPIIKEALGLAAKDHIVGFLHMGTPNAERPAPPRPDPAELTVNWHPESST
jgi:nitroreductase